MSTEIKQATIGILTVFSALTLGACGGSGSDDPGSSATELKSGVYHIGRLFSDGSTREGLSLISPTGNFVANLDTRSYTFGNVAFSASGKISGEIVEYILSPPWKLTNGTLSGQVVSSVQADLGAQSGNLSTTSVLLRNTDFNGLGVMTFETMSGTYTMSNPDNTSSITINSNGDITGGDQAGCIFNGELVIPDKTINVFEVMYTAENCPADSDEDASADDRNGEFSGLGFLSPSGDEAIFYSRNGTVGWMFKGSR